MKHLYNFLLHLLLIVISLNGKAQPFVSKIIYPEIGKSMEGAFTHYSQSTSESESVPLTHDNLGNYYIHYTFKGNLAIKGLNFSSIPNKYTFNTLLIKFNALGELVWSKQFQTTISEIAAYNGEVYLAGNPDKDFTLSPVHKDTLSAGNLWKKYLAHLDSNGNVKWVAHAKINLLNSQPWAINPYRVMLTVNDSAVFLGLNFKDSLLVTTTTNKHWFVSPNLGKIAILKFTKQGNLEWASTTLTATSSEVRKMFATNQNLYLTGVFTGVFSLQSVIGNSPSIPPYTGFTSNFIACINKSGTVSWLNGIRGNIQKLNIYADNESNEVYLAGNLFGGQLNYITTNLLNSTNNNDLFLIKIAQTGVYSWAKLLSSNSGKGINYISKGKSGILIAGFFYGVNSFSANALNFGQASHPNNLLNVFGTNNIDGFIANYLSNGNLNWARRAGGNGNDNCLMVYARDTQNITCITYCPERSNSFVTPHTETGLTAKGYDMDTYEWKLDKEGLNQSVDNFGILRDGHSEILCSKVDNKGNKYVAGYFTNFMIAGNTKLISEGGEDGFILKFNALDQLIWSKQIGGIGNVRINDIAVSDNRIYLTGGFSSLVNFPSNQPQGQSYSMVAVEEDAFYCSLDTLGQPLWVNKLSGIDKNKGFGISLFDNNLYLCGSFQGTVYLNSNSITLTSQGSLDGFIARINLSGTVEWCKRIGGNFEDEALSINVNNYGVFITGYFKDIANFTTPSTPFQNILSAEGMSDGFIAAFSHNGNLLWKKRFGGNSNDIGNYIVSSKNKIFIAGYFTSYAGFNAVGDFSSHLITAADSSQDGFVAAFQLNGDNIWQRRMGGKKSDMTKSLIVDGNRIFTCGYFNERFSFGTLASDTTIHLMAEPYYPIYPNDLPYRDDMFVNALDTLGNQLWASRGGGRNIDRANTLCFFQNKLTVGGFHIDSANFYKPSNFNNVKISGGLDLNPKAYLVNYIPLIISPNTDTLYCGGSQINYKVQVNQPISDSLLFTIELGNDSTYFINPILLYSWYGNVPDSIQFTLPNTLTENRKYKIRAICHATEPDISESANWFKVVNTPPPLALDTQSFCHSGRVFNLTATGNQLKWYLTDTSTIQLSNNYSLENNRNYFVSQSQYGCSSKQRKKVWINIKSVGKPTGDSVQYFCHQAKINELIVQGSNLKWYDTIADGQLLNTLLNLESHKTYYVSQTLNSCESIERLRLKANITQINPVVTKTNNTLFAHNGYDNYQWLYCDSDYSFVPQATSAIFEPSKSGRYAVRIIQNQCVDTSICLNILLPTIGLLEIKKPTCWLEPNPASSEITIYTPSSFNPQQILVCDAQGKSKTIFELNSINTTLNISELAAGMYYIIFNNSNYPPLKFIKY